MIDILGLFTGITTAVIGSSFAVYTVIKNSQNNEDEDTVDEETNEEESNEIVLVHSSSKSIVHHQDCRYFEEARDLP